MDKITKKQQEILYFLLEKSHQSSSEIHKRIIEAGEKFSLVTIKRSLMEMVRAKLLATSGAGPATTYEISTLGQVFVDIDSKKYCTIEPDNRFGSDKFNFDFFQKLPKSIFLEREYLTLEQATEEYRRKTSNVSETIQKKEMERLIIELSWKSSKIEGNTYTLLDTEKLILENKEAPGHTKGEAQMILNHKDAFKLVYENRKIFKELDRVNLEKLHFELVKDLDVGTGLRKGPVGILGSKYRPLDNIYQINEALDDLSKAIRNTDDPYNKALIALLGISYIQPFEDGNKRTSRLMANALLLSHDLAPLSYRNVNEEEYREAMLVFYELNAMSPFRKIFVSQYDFASRNYTLK